MTQKTYTLQRFIDFLRANPNLQVQGSTSVYEIGLVKLPKGKGDIYYGACVDDLVMCSSEQMLRALNNNPARSDIFYTNLRKLMDGHILKENLSLI